MYLAGPGWGLDKDNPAIGSMQVHLHLCSVATAPIVPAQGSVMREADPWPLARSFHVLGYFVPLPWQMLSGGY